MSMFDFKHHKTTITGLLMRVQTGEYTERDSKEKEVKQKIVVHILCNRYDPERDAFLKPEVEQFSSKSYEYLKNFEAMEGQIVAFPVSSMITRDNKTVYWIPLGCLPTVVPRSVEQIADQALKQPNQSITNSMGAKPPETK